MKKRNFKMGACAVTYQWLCVLLLFVVMFWDSDFSYFVNQHLVILGIILVILAIIMNAIDYYLRIRKDEKEKKQRDAKAKE